MTADFKETNFVRTGDFDLSEPLTPEMVAETTGARVALVVLLVKNGLLETIGERTSENDPVLLPRRAVLRLRRMQRLRRDLGVNFAGASVVLDMVERIEAMQREIEQMRRQFGIG